MNYQLQTRHRFFKLYQTLYKISGSIENRKYALYKTRCLVGQPINQIDKKKLENLDTKKQFIKTQIYLLKNIEDNGSNDERSFRKLERKVDKLSKLIYKKYYGLNTIADSLLDNSLHMSQLSVASESDL